ncbi:MAG: MFS transporter, partial [Anaerolineales bacterium]
GWGFAIHEAMDQVGAVIGPLIFTAVFVQRNSYRDGFNILWIPAILCVLVLIVARLRVPAPEKLENNPAGQDSPRAQGKPKLPPVFWVYAIFTFLSVAGFAGFQIISYHWATRAVVPAEQIAVLYAVAMGVDALAALVVGKTYDAIGLKSLLIIPLVSLPIPFLAFSQKYELAVASAVLWGIAMAIHETIMRAAIADLVPGEGRAFAYGIFNTLYGAAWFVSGAVLGLLYDYSLPWLMVYIVLIEIAALFVFPLISTKRVTAGQ